MNGSHDIGDLPPGCHVAGDRSVTFVLRDEHAQTVHVAGDFTRWSDAPLSMHRRDGGLWVVRTAPLDYGEHGYKYVVDGRWIQDPAHGLSHDDTYGGQNSVFVVSELMLGEWSDLRVASLNLHTYQEADALGQLWRAAFGLAAMNVDIVLLSEVGEHLHDPGRPNAGEVLRAHLNRLTHRAWHHHWREAHIGFDEYREGVSLLASSPLGEPSLFRLSEGFFARVALASLTDIKGMRLRLVSAHTSWGYDGVEELRGLLTGLGALPPDGAIATILGGDLNAPPRSPAIKLLLDAGFRDAGADAGMLEPTYGNPLQERIDYQLMRPLPGARAPQLLAMHRIFDGGPVSRGFQPRVSDHAGLLSVWRAPA